MRSYKILLIFLFFSDHLFAQRHPANDNPLKTAQDSAVNRAAVAYFRDSTAHGLVVGLVRHGKRTLYRYGESRIGSGQLPSVNSYFNMGSVAKTFVATLLAQAVIEKKASLNDDIRKYLPGKYPNLEYQGHPVRLIDLANHTSGLPESFRIFPATTMDSIKRISFVGQSDFFNQYRDPQLLEDLHRIRPDTLPGTRFRYNSNAYSLLIFLVERIYHRSFNVLSAAYLKTHLNLKHTVQVLPQADFRQTLQGYNNNNQPMAYVNLTGYYLGPSLNTTPNDLLNYIAAQLADRDPAIRLTHQRTFGKEDGFGLGLGWMTDVEKGRRYYYHDGNTKLGYNTLCTFYPGSGIGIVIIANDVHSLQKVGKAENDIAAELK